MQLWLYAEAPEEYKSYHGGDEDFVLFIANDEQLHSRLEALGLSYDSHKRAWSQWGWYLVKEVPGGYAFTFAHA